MMRYNTFILFGAPGSGKGTQGKTLGTIPRYYHCACGDVFRSIDTRTKVGKAFLEYSGRGQLVPDDITVELWREAIEAAVEAIEKNDYRLVVPIAFEVTHIPIQKIQPAPAKSSSQSRAIGKQILQTVKSHHSKSGAGQLGDPPGGPK